jgi:predicted nucleic-acid-binding protein
LIGLDTNILVRYLAQDDEKQSGKATKFIEKRITEKEPGFINYIVLVETIWVLENCYSADKQAIVNVIYQLASTKQLVLQDAEIVLRSLRLYEASNIDYADALLSTINNDNGCETTITFDKKAGNISSFTVLK